MTSAPARPMGGGVVFQRALGLASNEGDIEAAALQFWRSNRPLVSMQAAAPGAATTVLKSPARRLLPAAPVQRGDSTREERRGECAGVGTDLRRGGGFPKEALQRGADGEEPAGRAGAVAEHSPAGRTAIPRASGSESTPACRRRLPDRARAGGRSGRRAPGRPRA